MAWIVMVFLFFVGAALGSFINVVIERTTKSEQWVTGRSRCDHCNREIAWYDNIPVISYVVLGGRCRFCRKTIAIQHLIIEVLMGLLFVWWYVIGFTFFQLAQSPALFVQRGFWLVVGILLIIITVSDWLYFQIPLYATVPLTALSVLYRLYLSSTSIMRWEDFWLAIAMGVALAGFLGLIMIITKGKGMGEGDLHLALPMGILLGWPRGLVGMYVAFVAGAVYGIGVITAKKKKWKQRVPFGPFLVLGTVVALIWGGELWELVYGMIV